MKYETILTKREKEKAVLDSLFHPVEGFTLAKIPKERFDLGKYKPGTAAGRPVPDHMKPHVLVVWTERRRDAGGPYDALFSLPNPRSPHATEALRALLA